MDACTKFCEKNDIDISTCVVDKESILHKNWETIARSTALNKIKKWKRLVNASKVIVAMGGPTNFRDRLPLFQKYKDRVNSKKPEKLKEVRILLSELFTCIFSDDCEADDLIATYQYLGHKDKSYIVCTEDKDAKQTPGYIFNPRTEEIRCCNGFGAVELITKVSARGTKTYKIDGQGRSFLYYQLVCGDAVDTYHPFPKVVSALRFYNEFKDIDNDKDAWTYVASHYKSHYGDLKSWTDWTGTENKGTWIDILQAYVNVVHMFRKPKDFLDVRKILKQYDIE